MKREYESKSMLKSKGIVYFPPVNEFKEALNIYKECGGVIISLEEDGFLVDDVVKISKLYDIPLNEIEFYFRTVLEENSFSETEINAIIEEWREEEDIEKLITENQY